MLCPGKVFLVGGPVRDRLLGVQAHDNDWVVTGATPEQMLAAGFTQVGKDFPVFLHPQTRKNMPWPGQSGNRAMAIRALSVIPIRMSPWKTIFSAGILRSMQWH